MVMDMGLHAIPTLVEPQQIIQILIPGVEERARHLPPLTSTNRLMPGQLATPLAFDHVGLVVSCRSTQGTSSCQGPRDFLRDC